MQPYTITQCTPECAHLSCDIPIFTRAGFRSSSLVQNTSFWGAFSLHHQYSTVVDTNLISTGTVAHVQQL